MNAGEFEDWLAAFGRRAARPLVMGVLNVTPDSFSDGGEFATVEAAVRHAERMAAEGADLIDVGGESTRPGSAAVSEAEQIRRTEPVIAAVRRRAPGVVVSIDTTRAGVAERAIGAGAGMVNDISAGRDDAAMLPLCASSSAPIVLMHMQGSPRTMQDSPRYGDVVAEVADFLTGRRDAAREAGVAAHRVLLDVGIGFGKTTAHNLALLANLAGFGRLGCPMVVGVSRKSFIGEVTGEELSGGRRFGTAAAVGWSAANGAGVVRVHDVGAMSAVVRMVRAIATAQ